MEALNPYQVDLTRRLVAGGVRFVVVGGQAKHGFNPAFDLDLWIAPDAGNRAAAQAVILSWLADFDLHCRPGIAETVAMGLPERTMLAIPDDAVSYRHAGGIMAVSPANGVELMVGGAGLDFDQYASRAVCRVAGGLKLPCLNPADIAALPRLEKITQ